MQRTHFPIPIIVDRARHDVKVHIACGKLYHVVIRNVIAAHLLALAIRNICMARPAQSQLNVRYCASHCCYY